MNCSKTNEKQKCASGVQKRNVKGFTPNFHLQKQNTKKKLLLALCIPLNSAAIVNKDGEIIINSIKSIKTIYKFHYKINVVAELLEVAHGILEFHETQFENRWKSDTEKNTLR